MEEYLANILMRCSAYSAGLPLLIGLLNIRRLKIVQNYVFVLVVFSILVELLALWIGRGLHKNNLPLLHIYTAVQFTILWFIFYRRLLGLFSKKLMYGALALFWLFAIICAIWIDGIFNFNAHARSFGALLLIFFCLSYYYQRLRNLDLENLEQDPLFWVATASLIYFSGSLIMFIISNYVLVNEGITWAVWASHAILNTLNNLFYMIALWVRPTKLV